MNKLLILTFLVAAILVQSMITGHLKVSTSTGQEIESFAVRSRKQALDRSYNWTVEGDWTVEELDVLLKAAWNLQKYVESRSQVDGQAWMKRYIGQVTFHDESILNRVLSAQYSLPPNHIYMLDEYGHWFRPEKLIVHELAHILDNRMGGALPASFFGGGPADRMVAELGGNPEDCQLKFFCPTGYAEKIAGPEAWPEKAYGNQGVADDFAETLAKAVFRPDMVPPRRLAWMEAFIRKTGADMVE